MVCDGDGTNRQGMMSLDSGRNFGWAWKEYHQGTKYCKISEDAAETNLSFSWVVGNPGSVMWSVKMAGGLDVDADVRTVSVAGDGSVALTVFRDEGKIRVESLMSTPLYLYTGKGVFVTNLTARRNSRVGMVRRCSYGMNDYDIEDKIWESGASKMQRTYSFCWPTLPADRVLLMDYINAQIPARTMWTNGVPWKEEDLRVFRRHVSRTRSNVLYGDGTVKSADPQDIDPGNPSSPEKYFKYWNPK
jgi:hypothetical protein